MFQLSEWNTFDFKRCASIHFHWYVCLKSSLIENQIIFGTPFTMLGWFVNALLYYFTHRKGKSSFRDKFSRLNWTFSWEATGSGLFVNKSSKSSQKADILKTAEDINTILVTDYFFYNIRANVSNNTNKLKVYYFTNGNLRQMFLQKNSHNICNNLQISVSVNAD